MLKKNGVKCWASVGELDLVAREKSARSESLESIAILSKVKTKVFFSTYKLCNIHVCFEDISDKISSIILMKGVSCTVSIFLSVHTCFILKGKKNKRSGIEFQTFVVPEDANLVHQPTKSMYSQLQPI